MKNKMEKTVNGGGVPHLENKSGISLIVLVITILVIIVLAGAVILTVAKNNPFEQANEAVFKADLKQFSEDLGLSIANMMMKNPSIDINTINADFETPNNLLETYIPSIKGKNKYTKMVIVEKGKLVLKKTELKPFEEKWADEIGTPTIGKPIVSKIKDLALEVGMDNIKVKVLVDESENTVESYKYEIGKDINTLTVKDTNTLKDYTFNGLEVNTKYFVKVTIKDKNNTTAIEPMIKEIITGAAVVPVGSVKIDIGNGAYTNQNVTATITSPVIAGLKCRYSYNGTIWEDYTAPLTITKNTTIYAKMTYLNNEEITEGPGPAISTVSTIDKLTPNTPIVNLNGYTVNSWSKTNVTINLTATDKAETSDNAMSDILGYEYSTNAGTNYTAVNNPWIISNDTIGMDILFRSIDKATNKSDATTSYTVKKDATAPTISSVTGSNITDTSMSVTVTANDSTSGIKGYKLSKDNGATWTAEQTSNVFNLTGLTASTAYNIKAIVIDNAINEQTSATNTISTIAPPYGYNIPYTPTGFTHTDGTWNAGYVIKDNNNGNEFVWIPVKNIADFKRTDFGKGLTVAQCSETVPSNITTSVTNYGGYYIGRYEQGTGNVSKQGVSVYNYINWNDSLNQAKAMYNGNSEIATDLIYGTMWDTACIWLETSGNKTHAELLNSTSWGNYIDDPVDGNAGIRTTGYSNTWKANNIYDLAR